MWNLSKTITASGALSLITSIYGCHMSQQMPWSLLIRSGPRKSKQAIKVSALRPAPLQTRRLAMRS